MVAIMAWNLSGSLVSPACAAEDWEIVIARSPIIVAGTAGESL